MRCGVARFSDELRVLWADCMSRPELAWRAWPGVDLPATGLSGVGLGLEMGWIGRGVIGGFGYVGLGWAG